MSYVTSVGGDPINPNPFNYSKISMTGNIALVWPSNTQDATYTATNWVDITSSAAYTATMPPANEAGEGTESVFNNYGAYTITVNDSTGGNITTVASGDTIRIWIADNTTAAGTWRVSNIGSGTTNAVASTLAGYGLTAIAGQLSQSFPPLSYSTSATLNAGNRAALSIWTGGAGTFTLTAPATLGSNWFTGIKNDGSGSLTIDAGATTIDGSSTITVGVNEGFDVETDGVKFYTVGRLTPSTSNITQLNKSIAGTGDITLTSAESAYNIINFTGILTGNRNVIVPANVNEWIIFNNTTGAFSVTFKVSGQTGVVIAQATRRLVYCNGTDTFFSDSVGTGTVTSITAGTGLSGGTITTTGTVSLSNTAVSGGTYGDSTHYPSFTVNAQGQLTNADQTLLNSNHFFTAPAASTGSANAQVIATTNANFTLVAPNTVIFIPGFTNTNDMTAAIDGTTATHLYKLNTTGSATLLSGGEVQINWPCILTFFNSKLTVINPMIGMDGTNFKWSSTSNLAFGTAPVLPSASTGAFVKKLAPQIFTSSGTYTPSSGMLYCIAEVLGAGGGGGGTGAHSCGGGGAGAYGKSILSAATIGASKTVTIGAAGVAGSSGTGGTGGTSSLGTLISCTGGLGGLAGASGNNLGGDGGTATSANINVAGTYGGVASDGLFAGGGASTIYGAGGQGRSTVGAGNDALGYGGGGGGARSNATGGAGFAGYVVITEFCSQ